MKKPVSLLLLFVVLGNIIFIHFSCNKNDKPIEVIPLTVDLPRHTLMHDLYYQVYPNERSIELDFNMPLDLSSVEGNLSFYDKSGGLESNYTIEASGGQILMLFDTDFHLRNGWQYFIEIGPGLQSEDGHNIGSQNLFELRTLSDELPPSDLIGNDSKLKNAIACISDIHMGEERATDHGYCWFGRNKDALENFLEYVVSSQQFRKLVIMGDLFDEWLVPYTWSPFDEQHNISTNREYFLSVANSPVNAQIIKKLQDIAVGGEVELVYVPGNHDMLMTKEIMDEIIPNITWAGVEETPGLGLYSPLDEIIMEHGHRYDFFNCPQPIVNPGHKLPPGYFVSRLYAQGMMDQQSSPKSTAETSGSFEFETAWTIAYLYTIGHFSMPLPQGDSANILMGGIDSYSNPMSFDGTRKMYAENIEDLWESTQSQNQVPVSTECCFHAIWNGHSDLYTAAKTEYMLPLAPTTYKVVAFGHTHQPELKAHKWLGKIKNIYANSGSWIDAEASNYNVRTFLSIQPAEWTGSNLDVVSLYQYNKDNDKPDTYKPVPLGEESVETN